MTLIASYNTPPSDWTRALDYGFSEWSKHILGDARLRVEVVFDNTISFLASCSMGGSVKAGKVGGKAFFVPGALAAMQGRDNAEDAHMRVRVNLDHAWSFGASPAAGKYWAPGVMCHEIGHGLFAHGLADNIVTPFEIYRTSATGVRFADSMHFAGSGALMSERISRGEGQWITDLDLRAAAASGVPTKLGSTLYVVPGGRLVGTSKDIAVWMGRLADIGATVSGVKRLELRGDDPLTMPEADLYRLYRAAFGRMPDLTGFRWWAGQGQTLDYCAERFVDSDEYRRLYAGKTREQLIKLLYRNILGRDPDPSGLTWWLGQSHLPDWRVFAGFALAPENKIGVPTFSL